MDVAFYREQQQRGLRLAEATEDPEVKAAILELAQQNADLAEKIRSDESADATASGSLRPSSTSATMFGSPLQNAGLQRRAGNHRSTQQLPASWSAHISTKAEFRRRGF